MLDQRMEAHDDHDEKNRLEKRPACGQRDQDGDADRQDAGPLTNRVRQHSGERRRRHEQRQPEQRAQNVLEHDDPNRLLEDWLGVLCVVDQAVLSAPPRIALAARQVVRKDHFVEIACGGTQNRGDQLANRFDARDRQHVPDAFERRVHRFDDAAHEQVHGEERVHLAELLVTTRLP